MRIDVIGGGPAGLYFALLAKKAQPARAIRVLERNGPDATFGWGVVFSEETLGELRDADHPTYTAITDDFARWDAIDIHYQGTVERSRGHAFSAISRKGLLHILQERCRALGVELDFLTEQADLRSCREADVVVAADGVNSTVRRLHSETFQPSIRMHASRYAWFGTDLAFDAFTFVFRETPHGMFQVHAYPYDAARSTFIVECAESAWRSAGLETATEEESIAFCESLFAPELDGHKLLSNRSTWNAFSTVKCRSWHTANIVLLGDAAHTAHFSIGSGTKLAMEDAIVLANALDRHTDLESALTWYELERQPVVERFQEAARVSATYFENVGRYAGFPAWQFAFNLLTRSGRVTHRTLEQRDVEFVATVDREFAAQTEPRARHARIPPPPALARARLGVLELRSRIVLAAAPVEGARDGVSGEAEAVALQDVVAAGPGLAITGFVAVTAEGRRTAATAGMYAAAHEHAWADVLARAGAGLAVPLAIRLGHAGPRGAMLPRERGLDRPLRVGGWALVAASAVPYTPRGRVPAAADDAACARICAAFADAAARAATLGFDALELDMAGGGLLASFLSPLTNHRADRFAGDVAARLTYPAEVATAVRTAWPAGRPLLARIPALDWVPGGLQASDAVHVARALAAAGVDALHVTAGHSVPDDRPTYGRMYLAALADEVRNVAGVPVLVGGAITTRDDVDTLVAAGRADLCLLDAIA